MPPHRRTLAAVVALLAGLGAAPWSTASAAPSLSEARAAYDTATTALAQAHSDVVARDERVQVATGQLADLEQQQAALTLDESAAAGRYRDALGQARNMAVAGYVRGGQLWSIYEVMGARNLEELLRQRAGYNLAGIATATNQERLQDARDEAGELTVAVVVAVEGARQQLADAQRLAADAQAAVPQAEQAIEVARVAFEAARIRTVVPGTDLPAVAYDAYHQAAAIAEAGDPGCGIEWWMVAGVGRIESGHGGKRMRLNGDTSGIVGIQLTGEEGSGTAFVPDSDGGEYDGDVDFDRAVGPMQFLPGTWKRWRTDGNGDGATNPNNIYDAAVGGARYLCASRRGQSMADTAGLRTALLSYNHSDHYVDVVSSSGYGYRDAAIPEWALPIPPPPAAPEAPVAQG